MRGSLIGIHIPQRYPARSVQAGMTVMECRCLVRKVLAQSSPACKYECNHRSHYISEPFRGANLSYSTVLG